MANLENTIITPWQEDNKQGIIKSNVDKQDELSLEDFLENPSITSAGSAIENTGLQFLSQTYTGNISNFIDGVKGNDSESRRPINTVSSSRDLIGVDFKKIKEEKYKNVKLTSKLGQYNSINNLLGIASGMYVGTLGKSAIANAADDALSMALQSLPGADLATNIPTLIERVANTVSNSSDISSIVPTNIIDLARANYYTILTSKPGLKIRSHGKKLEYITGNNNTYELVSEDELEKFKKKYKFLYKDGELDENYFTGINLKNNGVFDVNKSLRNETQNTYIDSIKRKEVQIGIKRDSRVIGINEYELPEDKKALDDFLTTSENKSNNIQFPRVTKARIYNRVNNIFREIGGLYIEPFFAGKNSPEEIRCFEIPFEFNPTITEGSSIAEYSKTDLMSRILPIRSYISSDAGTVTIEAQYIALADNKRGYTNKSDNWTNGWMTDWTTSKLKDIEAQYRSLVLPYIEGANFVRPPIVRIKMRSAPANAMNRSNGELNDSIYSYENSNNLSELTVGDLFKYPSTGEKLQISAKLYGATRDKRYVVTSVTISPLEQPGTSYRYGTAGLTGLNPNVANYNPISRNGFKVNIQLAETTKNFLDLIPSYAQYVGKNAVDMDYNYNFKNYFAEAAREDINLWDCLKETMKIDVSHINKDSENESFKEGFLPFAFYNEDANFVLSDEIKEGETTSEREALGEPDLNLEKDLEVYIKELKGIGKQDKEIMSLLFNSSWYEKEIFKNYLFGGKCTLKETSKEIFMKNNNEIEAFEQYINFVKNELGLNNTQFISNIRENWSSTDSYKQWFIAEFTKDLNAAYDQGITFRDIYDVLGAEETITKLQGTVYDINPEKDYIPSEDEEGKEENEEKDYGYNHWLFGYKTVKDGKGDGVGGSIIAFSGDATKFYNALVKEKKYTKERAMYIILSSNWNQKNSINNLIISDKELFALYFRYYNDSILPVKKAMKEFFEQMKKDSSIFSFGVNRTFDSMEAYKRTFIAYNIVEKFAEAVTIGVCYNSYLQFKEIIDGLKSQQYNFVFKKYDKSNQNSLKQEEENKNNLLFLLKDFTDEQIISIMDKTKWENDNGYKEWKSQIDGIGEEIETIDVYEDDYEYYVFIGPENKKQEEIVSDKEVEDNSDLKLDSSFFSNDNFTDEVRMLWTFYYHGIDGNKYGDPNKKESNKEQ